jgi:hypothetical protein
VCQNYLIAKYQKETKKPYHTNGLQNPATCNAHSNVPVE